MKIIADKIQGHGRPFIAVVGGLHGDEPVGEAIVRRLRDLELERGTLITIIGNPKALKQKRRFIKHDLNRIFPGNIRGSAEQRRAQEIFQLIKGADYVIDIHSTTSNTTDVMIIKKQTPGVRRLISGINPRRVVVMPPGIGDGALINHHTAAISLEYGRHNSHYTYQKTLSAIFKFLAANKMINRRRLNRRRATDYYRVFGTRPRPTGFRMKKSIRNFQLIRKGEILGWVGREAIRSQDNFYPVLFGPTSYRDIMGFQARKKTLA
ncbi:MAG: succinylglutamate desuccinylase/aspartoacylase family protein [Candidatus Komeilibacteria bacterium]|nr:succinylglutamate desuccinylase/aspartoacylase family protein [Candidatus Komeilibacteria bacterium]